MSVYTHLLCVKVLSRIHRPSACYYNVFVQLQYIFKCYVVIDYVISLCQQWFMLCCVYENLLSLFVSNHHHHRHKKF